MRIGLAACLFLTLAIAAPAALAGPKPLPIGKVVAEQLQLRAQLEAGSGPMARIPSAQRIDMLARQQELLDVLGDKESVSQLSEAQQAFAHNTLAWIEAAVENNDDERMVCVREKALGSNMAKRVCRTLAQMRQAQEYAREEMMQGSRD